MKKVLVAAALMIPIALALGLGGCLVEDREVEVVLNQEHCEEFVEHHTTENYTTPTIIELGEDLDRLLADNDVSREDIVNAFLVSAFYEVTEFMHTHDWEITGAITVQRLHVTGAEPETLIVYSELSLEDKLGEKTQVVLHPDGVAVVNTAMADYIAGGNPAIQLMVVNGAVGETSPSVGDPLDFVWEACLNIQVVVTIDTEIFNFMGGS
jgi:hypothetical protein